MGFLIFGAALDFEDALSYSGLRQTTRMGSLLRGLSVLRPGWRQRAAAAAAPRGHHRRGTAGGVAHAAVRGGRRRLATGRTAWTSAWDR
jgi:hypothetical protein